LLANTSLQHTDTFSAHVTFWADSEIAAGLSLSCSYNHIHCQIHSKDSTWFRGKREEMVAFFRERRPWYSCLKKAVPFINAVLPSGLVALIVLGVFRHNWLSVIFLTASLLVFTVAAILEYYQRLFPFVRVYFRDRKGIDWTPELVVSILTLLMTTIAVVVTILK
jgi:hypothetical protein